MQPLNTSASTFGDTIAKVVLDKYNKLGNKGKPHGNEWTVLAGIVLETVQTQNEPGASQSGPETGANGDAYGQSEIHEHAEGAHSETHSQAHTEDEGLVEAQSHRKSEMKVVALGTGNKCLADSQRTPLGDVVRDSHAEVIARRSLVKFLVLQLRDWTGGKPSIFVPAKGTCTPLKLKDGVKFHLYVSQSLCGDASVYPPEMDIRTGSKPVPGQSFTEENHWSLPGLLRFKPGRGDKNTSISCSGKVAKWNVLGLQGALLSRFIAPIYLSSITIGDYYCFEATERAIWTRIRDIGVRDPYKCHLLEIHSTSLLFPRGKVEMTKVSDKTGTSSNAINWHYLAEVEVTSVFGGKKMGTTSKNFSQPSQRSRICKFCLYEDFKGLLGTFQGLHSLGKKRKLTEIEAPNKKPKLERNQKEARLDEGLAIATKTKTEKFLEPGNELREPLEKGRNYGEDKQLAKSYQVWVKSPPECEPDIK